MSRLGPKDDPLDDKDEAERLRPLEERLRDLAWPQPPPGVRERTLGRLRRKLAETGELGNGGPPEEADEAEEARRGREAR